MIRGTLKRFDELGLSAKTLEAVKAMGYDSPTPVQEKAIPLVLEGRDIIAAAKTGTGKTGAFSLPSMDKLGHAKGGRGPLMLVITPTRELADQIGTVCGQIAQHTNHRITTVVGGLSYNPQIEKLRRGTDVLIATPGRLIDLMDQKAVNLSEVSLLVLDEADRMLDMGFIQDVTRILDKIPNRKNLGMFSATISREVMDISWVYQRDPEEITVQATKENKPDILQYRIEIPSDQKVDTIARIIAGEKLERVMCFCNTKGSTERLTKFLQMRGLDAQCIHGDIPQRKREAVMALFREGKLHVFVATDVAARGIDVDDVDAVFNYDVPDENEYYIHRIGRTGRAKRHGVAYTLLSDFPSRMRLDDIARNTRSQIIPAVVDENGCVAPEKK